MKKIFGHELRRLRGLAGLTLKDIADVFGWSIVYVSDIERSKRNPPGSREIEKMLIRMGKLEALPEMIRLAAEARRSIEFEVNPASDPKEVNILLAFKRRIDNGGLKPQTRDRIQELLDEDEKKPQ
jgi:transcriptional regulator with XRE-family HTH domain